MSNTPLNKALEDLDSAFANLEVKPLSNADLGRVVGATLDIGETCGATCNSKCGPTAYWECGGGTNTCDEVACYTNCMSWGPTCRECGHGC